VREWQTIHTAPHGVHLELAVIEKGEVYALVFRANERSMDGPMRPPECVIRGKAATDSDAIWPPIPTEVGHPFRLKPATLLGLV